MFVWSDGDSLKPCHRCRCRRHPRPRRPCPRRRQFGSLVDGFFRLLKQSALAAVIVYALGVRLEQWKNFDENKCSPKTVKERENGRRKGN